MEKCAMRQNKAPLSAGRTIERLGPVAAAPIAASHIRCAAPHVCTVSEKALVRRFLCRPNTLIGNKTNAMTVRYAVFL
ncbi:hypothetical protein RHI9324_03835 [Rhizobium sp. CECT 9324]|nr:hypothetical protein RHI9324_03835 [Rhizobium sp. CECT 9324]